MPIHDKTDRHRVGGKQFPDDIRMARQHLRTSVAQMGRERRACCHRAGDFLWRRCRVADCGAHTGRDQALHQRHGARHFRSERHEHDPAVRSVLPSVEVVEGRRHQVLSRMRTAGAVLGRQVRPLHVDPGDRWTAHARKDPCVSSEQSERRGNKRGQAAGHARDAHPIQGFDRAVGCEVRGVEIDATEAVHLQIEQPGQLESHDRSLPRISPRMAGVSSAADSRSRNNVVFACV